MDRKNILYTLGVCEDNSVEDNREKALQLLRELNEMRLELPLEYMDLNYELADLIKKYTDILYTIRED